MKNITPNDITVLTILRNGDIIGDSTKEKHLLNPYPKTKKALCAIAKLLKYNHRCFVAYQDIYFELVNHTPQQYISYPESHIYPDWTKDEWQFIKNISGLDEKHKEKLQKRQVTSLDAFFTWRPSLALDPNWFSDYRGHFGINRYKNNQETFFGKPLYTLRLTDTNGIVIPSNDLKGKPLRPQVIPDTVHYQLKAKMNPHTIISHNSYYDNKKRVYTFLKNNQPSRLQVIDSTTLEDCDGPFKVKENLVQQLKQQGYAIPPTITQLHISTEGKYTYLKPGNVGTEEITATILPVQHQNITSRVRVILVEGALKGAIVADQLRTNKSPLTAQLYANDLFIIQLNGINCPYDRVLQQLKETYDQVILYIALDMDLFANKRVATRVHDIAMDLTSRHIGPMTAPTNEGVHCVMLWNKIYKGLDDYLINVTTPQITLQPVEKAFDINAIPNYKTISVGGLPVTTYTKQQKEQEDHIIAIKNQYKSKQKDYQERLENTLGNFFNS